MTDNTELDEFISLIGWAKRAGFSGHMLRRYQRQGWLDVYNINGRKFSTRKSIAEFTLRAKAGEFAKVPAVAQRNKRQSAKAI